AYTEVAPGETVPRGSIIYVYISGGGLKILPDVTGLSVPEAFAALEGEGFFPSYPQPSQWWMLNKCEPALPNNVVHSTEPAAGSAVIDASAVIVMPNQCF
ncbi:MAG: PASTA domain-containing protein, partial [Aquiluna sp.]